MQYYSIQTTVLLVNGIPIKGFADGDDVIQGSRREDGFRDRVGADGRMMVSQNANRSGEIIIRLQQGSEANIVLDQLYKLQEKAATLGVAVLFKNLITGETMGGSTGYIVRPADISRGAQANNQEWRIVVEDYDVLFLGLPTIPPPVATTVSVL